MERRKIAINLGDDSEVIRRWWKVSAGDVCVDGGFGPGPWTLAALSRGAWVFAFDPNPHALRVMTGSLLAFPRATACVIPAGLWEASGTASFKGTQFTGGEETVATPVIALDDFIVGYHIGRLDWINLDVEWAEIKVLRGAQRTLARFRPRVIIDVHGDARDELKRELHRAVPGYLFTDDGDFLIAACPDDGRNKNELCLL